MAVAWYKNGQLWIRETMYKVHNYVRNIREPPVGVLGIAIGTSVCMSVHKHILLVYLLTPMDRTTLLNAKSTISSVG